jgi:hypothetical protein
VEFDTRDTSGRGSRLLGKRGSLGVPERMNVTRLSEGTCLAGDIKSRVGTPEPSDWQGIWQST